MKKILTSVFAVFLSVALVACGNPGTDATNKDGKTVQIKHELGTVDVPVNPQKIAVLDLAVLDIIDGLGVGDKVVGIPKKSEVSYLKSYNDNKDIVNLGSVKEIDMEKLNALKPDVIFIGGRLSSQYEELSKLAPVVLNQIDHKEAGYMESFKQNVNNIASIFEKETEAKNLLDGFESRVDKLAAAAKGKTSITGLVTSGSLSTLGNGARASLITNEVGFKNSADDVNSTHGDSSSFELLLDKNPDYIFVLDRDSAIHAEGAKVAKDVMDNEIVRKTDAYKNNRIVYLTPDVWYLAEGGITATDMMLKDLENGIL